MAAITVSLIGSGSQPWVSSQMKSNCGLAAAWQSAQLPPNRFTTSSPPRLWILVPAAEVVELEELPVLGGGAEAGRPLHHGLLWHQLDDRAHGVRAARLRVGDGQGLLQVTGRVGDEEPAHGRHVLEADEVAGLGDEVLGGAVVVVDVVVSFAPSCWAFAQPTAIDPSTMPRDQELRV